MTDFPMKQTPIVALTWPFLVTLVCCHAAPVMRDAATNEELTEKYRKAVASNPLQKAEKTPIEGPDPTKVNQPQSLLASSDFLTFRGITTLIPKGAVLSVPKNYQDRMRRIPGTQIVPWLEFYGLNRGWIKTVEVSLAQAQGKDPFDETLLEGIQKSSLVVIATLKGGPISVLPPKEPEEPAEGADHETKKP